MLNLIHLIITKKNMAFNEQEQQIIQFGRDNGKTPQQIKQAINSFRSKEDTFQQPKKPSFGERIRETGQDISQTIKNIGGRFSKGADEIAEVKSEQQQSGQGQLRTASQKFGVGLGVGAGIFDDLFTGVVKTVLTSKGEEKVKELAGKGVEKVMGAVDVSTNVLEQTSGRVRDFLSGQEFQNRDDNSKKAIVEIIGFADKLKKENPGLARDFNTVINAIRVGTEVAGSHITQKGAGIAKRKTVDVVQDTAKRISTLRQGFAKVDNVVPSTPAPSIVGKVDNVVPSITSKVEKVGFMNNPTISGAVSDIKLLSGLGDSVDSTALTFKAIRPRIKKGVTPNRMKAQIGLANKTIVENKIVPTGLNSYSDAISSTKKKVWEEIQNKLDDGQLEGLQIDLDDIGLKILDMAEDSALARVNPNAQKELLRIAEWLTEKNGKVDIFEAEKIKQYINAELKGTFGNTDLSQTAINAQKLITVEIGNRLDDVLAKIPGEFKDLKIRYGALSSIEEDVLKRIIIFERQNPEGLADILTKTQAAGDIVLGGPTAKAKAVARLTLQKQLKKMNDANDLIKRAFESLTK